ncbi:uncharacterized protein MONOS_7754 [Monocercomonoides exilis]|uniref:uncharacterized protein n=1 Tax=Monocercomonoides exilis TaxID=2049356 RepID=UPI00355A4A78|nr:hypothetical protein MONOS_7754 [Monocercomonoides exilis]|eukprot:MONOS_7754.1-p1 / transcript=MONOS_7754.1 / gene=MONOS_7754 / organism=Monocercomonoides_exilis_PA203 / gene_product=unspecified product / transcript_product=unspecified product / location=Mono_scaffold00273:47945-50061(+) / protein_length=669 / sequence_SO=supercontig / SO=protein_coding / is_pseudo=false
MQGKDQDLILFAIPAKDFDRKGNKFKEENNECINFSTELQQLRRSCITINNEGSYTLVITSENLYTVGLLNCKLQTGKLSINGSFFNPGGTPLPSYEMSLPIYYLVSASVWAMLFLYCLGRVAFFHSIGVGCALHWGLLILSAVRCVISIIHGVSINYVTLYRRERPLWYTLAIMELTKAVGSAMPMIVLWLSAIGASITHRSIKKTTWAAMIVVSLLHIGFRLLTFGYSRMTFIGLIIILTLVSYHLFANNKANKNALKNQLVLIPLRPVYASFPIHSKIRFTSRFQIDLLAYSFLRLIYLIFVVAIPEPFYAITIIFDDSADALVIFLYFCLIDTIAFNKMGETELRMAVLDERLRHLEDLNTAPENRTNQEPTIFQGINLNHITFTDRVVFRVKKNGLYLKRQSLMGRRRDGDYGSAEAEQDVPYELEDAEDTNDNIDQGDDITGFDNEGGHLRRRHHNAGHHHRHNRVLSARERRAQMDEIDIDIEGRADDRREVHSPAIGIDNEMLDMPFEQAYEIGAGDADDEGGTNLRGAHGRARHERIERNGAVNMDVNELDPILQILMLLGDMQRTQEMEEGNHHHHHRRRGTEGGDGADDEDEDEDSNSDETDSSSSDLSNDETENEESRADAPPQLNFEVVDQTVLPSLLVVSEPDGTILTAINDDS